MVRCTARDAQFPHYSPESTTLISDPVDFSLSFGNNAGGLTEAALKSKNPRRTAALQHCNPPSLAAVPYPSNPKYPTSSIKPALAANRNPTQSQFVDGTDPDSYAQIRGQHGTCTPHTPGRGPQHHLGLCAAKRYKRTALGSTNQALRRVPNRCRTANSLSINFHGDNIHSAAAQHASSQRRDTWRCGSLGHVGLIGTKGTGDGEWIEAGYKDRERRAWKDIGERQEPFLSLHVDRSVVMFLLLVISTSE